MNDLFVIIHAYYRRYIFAKIKRYNFAKLNTQDLNCKKACTYSRDDKIGLHSRVSPSRLDPSCQL